MTLLTAAGFVCAATMIGAVSAHRSWRVRLSFSLLALCVVAGTTIADEPEASIVLLPGSSILCARVAPPGPRSCPAGAVVPVETERVAISRRAEALIVGVTTERDELRSQVHTLAADNARLLARPQAGGAWSGLRWGLVGAAVVGAFAAGAATL